MIGQLTGEQIEEVLKENILGHLGCNDGLNTYIYPINYLYDGKYIVCHSQTGSKIQVMRLNKRVCFQVDEVKNFMNWKSVMIHGEYQEFDEERERYYAMKAFVDRMLHPKITEPVFLQGRGKQAAHLYLQRNNRPAIYRIVIDEKTGRYENE
ncbi:MAG: pyridoxamine 5'-phosphate oxidase family protein [Ferruginibacter sp.]